MTLPCFKWDYCVSNEATVFQVRLLRFEYGYCVSIEVSRYAHCVYVRREAGAVLFYLIDGFPSHLVPPSAPGHHHHGLQLLGSSASWVSRRVSATRPTTLIKDFHYIYSLLYYFCFIEGVVNIYKIILKHLID